MLTVAGSGYSRWRDIAVTRWREDATQDCWGSYIFLRDTQTGYVWSAGISPAASRPTTMRCPFPKNGPRLSGGMATGARRSRSWCRPRMMLRYVRISVTNMGTRARDLQVTSCRAVPGSTGRRCGPSGLCESVCTNEFVPEIGALLARRRRSDEEATVWAAQVVVVEGDTVGELQYETDRARFLGRGHHVRTAVSMIDGRPLSNTVGSVLDPVMSLRRTVECSPAGPRASCFRPLSAHPRSGVDLADKYSDPSV